jgi:hypothetical protein
MLDIEDSGTRGLEDSRTRGLEDSRTRGLGRLAAGRDDPRRGTTRAVRPDLFVEHGTGVSGNRVEARDTIEVVVSRAQESALILHSSPSLVPVRGRAGFLAGLSRRFP